MLKHKWIYVISLSISILCMSGCEITVGFVYENKLTDNQNMKTTIELTKINVGK